MKPLAPNHTASGWQSQDLFEFKALALSLRSGAEAGESCQGSPAHGPGRALRGGLCFIDGEGGSDRAA